MSQQLARIKHSPHILLLLCVCGLLTGIPSATGSQASISLTDNQYKGIIVVFSPDLPQSDKSRRSLVQELQDIFQTLSDELFKATNERAYFKEVTFLLPKSWDVSGWPLPLIGSLKKTRTLRSGDADFIVTGKETGFGDNPRTIQFGGCGKPGAQVEVPFRFISQVSEEIYGSRPKALLHEWAHYRYGVFDEYGFPGDERYPMFYTVPGSESGQVKVTSCTATSSDPVNVQTDNKTRDGEICDLSTHGKDCIPLPDLKSDVNQKITSSLMYQQALRGVSEFCSEGNHDKEAPNKQNALCEERSVSEVIYDHIDFKDRNPSRQRTDKKTDFKFLQEAGSRVAIVVDAMDEDNLSTQDLLTPVIQKFTGDMAVDSTILILSMKTSTELWDAQWKSQVDFNSIFYARKEPGSMSLEHVFKRLETNWADDEEPSLRLLIVTRGQIQDSDKYQETYFVDQLKRWNAKLQVVIYPYQGTVNPTIRNIVEKVGGNIVLIKAEAEETGNAYKVGSQLRFIDAFTGFADEGDLKKRILIGSKTFEPSQGQSVEFRFPVDESLGSYGVQVHAYFAQPKVKLDQSYTLSVAYQMKFTDDPLYNSATKRFEVPVNKDFGQWTLRLKTSEKVVAFAYASITPQSTPITAQCWLSSQSRIVTQDARDPLAIYVSVTQESTRFVQNARVSMTLSNESGDLPPIYLTDDGLGDPDITKGDGIYSGYISDAESVGFYQIKVEVTSEGMTSLVGGTAGATNSLPLLHSEKICCGSSVAGFPSRPVRDLKRTLDCGTVYIKTGLSKDNYVGRVAGLKVEKVNQDDRKLTVKWPVPSGSIGSLEFSFFRERSLIRSDFESSGDSAAIWSDKNASTPIPDYGREMVTDFEFKYPGESTFYFAIRVTSAGDLKLTRISNIVSFKVKADPSIATTEASGIAGFTELETWHYIAIGVGSLILLVVCIACLICCICRRKRNSKKARYVEDPPAKVPRISTITPTLSMDGSNGTLPEKLPQNGISTISDRHLNAGSVPELNTTFSPVGSWPADVLLDHYGRVQKARERKEPVPVMRVEDLPPDNGSSSSDNPSRGSVSYDENTYPANYHTGDWRYQDQGHHPTYSEQPYFHPNQHGLMGGGDEADWRNPYERTDSPVSDYDPRYNAIPRRVGTAVSQV